MWNKLTTREANSKSTPYIIIEAVLIKENGKTSLKLLKLDWEWNFCLATTKSKELKLIEVGTLVKNKFIPTEVLVPNTPSQGCCVIFQRELQFIE